MGVMGTSSKSEQASKGKGKGKRDDVTAHSFALFLFQSLERNGTEKLELARASERGGAMRCMQR
jgi:hypothetical protein